MTTSEKNEKWQRRVCLPRNSRIICLHACLLHISESLSFTLLLTFFSLSRRLMLMWLTWVCGLLLSSVAIGGRERCCKQNTKEDTSSSFRPLPHHSIMCHLFSPYLVCSFFADCSTVHLSSHNSQHPTPNQLRVRISSCFPVHHVSSLFLLVFSFIVVSVISRSFVDYACSGPLCDSRRHEHSRYRIHHLSCRDCVHRISLGSCRP